MRNVKEKVIVLVAGFVAVILFLELFLRIWGMSPEKRDGLDATGRNKGAYTILCVGDSHTYGLGVTRNEAYPYQLEGILRGMNCGQWNVINEGLSGQNSSELLSSLPEKIAKYTPDMVILLTGSNNEWNRTGCAEYLETRTLYGQSCEWANTTSIVKLVRLLGANVADANHARRVRCNRGQVAQPGLWHSQSALSKKTCAARLSGDNGAYERYILEAVQQHSADANDFFDAATIYASRLEFEKEIDCFIAGIRVDPDDELNRNYGGVRKTYPMVNRALQNRVVSFFEEMLRQKEGPATLMRAMLKDMASGDNKLSKVNDKWLEHDLQDIIELCLEKKVVLLIQSYPHAWHVNNVIGAVAKKNLVPFFDQQGLFKGLVHRDNQQKYFLPDMHPTAEGYRLIADGLSKLVLKEKQQGKRMYPKT